MMNPRRLGKVALHAGTALALLAVFVAAFVVGIALHLPLPPSRRVATRALTAGIGNQIQGSIDVDRFERLSLGGFEARDVVIRDPEGTVVLATPRLRARANMLSMATSALLSSGPIELRFAFVRADLIDVNLIEGKDGKLTLGRTFLPPVRPPPTVPTVPSAPSRPVVVDLPAIEIGSIRARGAMKAVGVIDADAQGVTGSVFIGPGEVRIDTRPFPVVVPRVLPAVLGMTLDFHFRTPGLFWSDFLASFGDILFSGKAKLDGKYVDAVIDVPRTTTDPFIPYFQDLKPGEPLEAHVEWHGALPLLDTIVNVQLSQATLDARGRLVTTGGGTDFNVSLRHVNLSSVRPTLPATDLGLDAHVQLDMGAGRPLTAIVSGTMPATTLAGVEIPDSKVQCAIDQQGARGTLWLQEPGMPIEATFNVTRSGDLDVKASTTIVSMGRAPRLRNQVEGRAEATLDAKWSGGRLDATLVADVMRAHRGAVELGSGRITAHASGAPDAIEIDGSIQGAQFGLGGLRWQTATATFRGPLLKPRAVVRLRDKVLPSVRAEAALILQKNPGLQGVSVTIERGGETVVVKTAAVQSRGGDVDLGRLTVSGMGDEFEATARVGADGFRVRAVSDGVKIERIAGLMGLPVADVRGQAAFSIDLEGRGGETHGCIAFDAQRAMVVLPDVDASFRALFAGTKVTVEANGSMAGAEQPGAVEQSVGECLPARRVRGQAPVAAGATAEFTLAGAAMNPKSWTDATGTASLSSLLVDFGHPGMNRLLGLLEQVTSAKPPPLTGQVKAHGSLARESAEAPPSWSLSASTTGFSIDLGTKDDPKRVEGADVYASASMTSAGHLTASACVRDDQGSFDTEPCDATEQNVLVTFAGSADVDYPAWLHHSERWRTLLAQAKVDATLAVQERSFAALKAPIPWAVGLPVDAQRAAAWVRLQGSLVEPRIDYAAQVLEAAPVDPSWRLAETICAFGAYDGARAGLYAEVLHRESELPAGASLNSLCRDPRWRSSSSKGPAVFLPVGNITANIDVDWSLATRSTAWRQVPWAADVVASLHDINLADVPAFTDNDIEGTLSISGGIRNLGLSPEFGIQADVTGLRVGPTARYDKTELVLRTDERGMGGTLKLMNADPRRGMVTRLAVGVDTRQVQWSEGLTPRFSSDERVDGWLEASDFDAAVLGPLVAPTLSYLEGRLNGSAYATWSPKAGESAVHMADLTLSDGAFEVPVLGQEFTGATARIRATGRNQLAVDRVVARAATGAIAANARIDLQGLIPKRLAVGAASDRKNRLRLTYEGIPVGDFDGEVFASIYFGAERNEALIEVDNAHLELSESELRNVQQTTPNPDITVVPNVGTSGRLVPASRFADAWKLEDLASETKRVTPWYVRFVTRSPVVVTRSDLNVSVASPDDTSQAPLLVIPDEAGRTRMEGYIQLVDGRLNVVGKHFDIEHGQGRIIFDGDPGAPSVNLATRWDAPDGTRVVAEVTGPLKDPRVRFRSVPARPASEILAMILTGTSGTESTTPGTNKGGDTSAAAGVGGGVAAVGINRVLQDVSPVSVSTRVDTSESQNVRPTIAVEVARNVTAETTVNTGALAPGQTQDVYMLTLDWRFLREWSMRTTVGNKGSSVFDVVWQHRY